MCKKDTGCSTDLPISTETVLIFIDWLLRIRKVKASTVNSYLAGIRQLHIIRGLQEPQIRTGLVQLILKGQENIDATAKRSAGNKGRLPVTLALLKILKSRIREQKWANSKKLLIWAVCSIAFHGAFRIHELLARQQGAFDPDFTLLDQEAKIQTCIIEGQLTKCIEIKVKNPKESRAGSTTIIDVFETKGATCPVRAFEKWEKTRKHSAKLPLFRDEDDTPLTGAKLNRILKSLLGTIIDYKRGSISTHSFRSGLASLMAQKGLSDEEIQTMGRWSSRAFERYIKLPRTKRAATAMKMGNL